MKTWMPQPKQAAMLSSDVEDILFGGARFGGKTDGLLGDFANRARIYGGAVRGILFRRSFPELEEVQARLREAFAEPDEYNESKHTWTLPSGASLKLRYLETNDDVEHYVGHQYCWMAFDQLEQWPDATATDKLWGSLRSPQGIPCVRRSTAQPGGVGHTWVKTRYIDHDPEGMRPFVYQPNPKHPTLTIRALFIKSLLEDNAFAANDPSYEARLAAAGSDQLYRAWRYGDWDAIVGAVFDEWRQDLHVIRTDLRIPRGWNWAGGLDWGYRAPGWFGLFAAGPDGDLICTQELYFRQETAERVGRAIGLLCQPYPVEYVAGDEQMWYKTGVSSPTIAEELQKGMADCYASLELTPKLIEATHGRGSRVVRCQLTHRYLSWQTLPDGKTIPPWGRPRLRFMARCKAAIRTIPALPADKTHPEDVDSDAEDHCLAEGTIVLTADGWRPIEELAEARIAAYDASLIYLEVGGWPLYCTPDHRILTPDGWIEAQHLRRGQSILWWSPQQCRAMGGYAGIVAVPISSAEESGSIGESGAMPSVASLDDTLFTTSTAIARTTRSRTSNAGAAAPTRRTTLLIPPLDNAPRGIAMPSDPVVRAIALSLQHDAVKQLDVVGDDGRRSTVYDVGALHALHGFVSAGGFVTHNCYDGLGAYLMSRPPLPEPEYIPPVKDQHPGFTKRGKRAPSPPPPWERAQREQSENPFRGFRVPRNLEPVE